MFQKILSIVAIVLIVAGAAVGILYAMGRIAVLVKNPTDTIAVIDRACGDELITEYNSVFLLGDREEYVERLKTVSDKIDQIDEYDRDPNCVYMKLTYYMQVSDIEGSQRELESLKALASEGTYATAQLENAQGIRSTEEMVDIVIRASEIEQPETPVPGQDAPEGNG